jgi:hypothetical protein
MRRTRSSRHWSDDDDQDDDDDGVMSSVDHVDDDDDDDQDDEDPYNNYTRKVSRKENIIQSAPSARYSLRKRKPISAPQRSKSPVARRRRTSRYPLRASRSSLASVSKPSYAVHSEDDAPRRRSGDDGARRRSSDDGDVRSVKSQKKQEWMRAFLSKSPEKPPLPEREEVEDEEEDVVVEPQPESGEEEGVVEGGTERDEIVQPDEEQEEQEEEERESDDDGEVVSVPAVRLLKVGDGEFELMQNNDVRQDGIERGSEEEEDEDDGRSAQVISSPQHEPRRSARNSLRRGQVQVSDDAESEKEVEEEEFHPQSSEDEISSNQEELAETSDDVMMRNSHYQLRRRKPPKKYDPSKPSHPIRRSKYALRDRRRRKPSALRLETDEEISDEDDLIPLRSLRPKRQPKETRGASMEPAAVGDVDVHDRVRPFRRKRPRPMRMKQVEGDQLLPINWNDIPENEQDSDGNFRISLSISSLIFRPSQRYEQTACRHKSIGN